MEEAPLVRLVRWEAPEESEAAAVQWGGTAAAVNRAAILVGPTEAEERSEENAAARAHEAEPGEAQAAAGLHMPADAMRFRDSSQR